MAATAGNQAETNFFSNATRNRLALVPGAAHLIGYANKGNLGQGASTTLNSQVRASQMNGSGPAITPIKAPYSFAQFATGFRTLALKRIGK